MSGLLRQREILEVLARQGRVTTDDLADRFGVAVQTIRRDLVEMADAGRLTRIHGGAVPRSGTVNIDYQDRRALDREAKDQIARVIAAGIAPGASVFLNIGTTTEAVANALLEHDDLLVVTNNMNVARTMAANASAEIVLTGGTLRRKDGGLTGSAAIRTIEQFRFDVAVIGCSALDENGDILDFDVEEVAVSQAILRQARQSWLAADSGKFTRTAPVRIASFAELDVVATDRPLPGHLAQKCADWGTAVVIAGA